MKIEIQNVSKSISGNELLSNVNLCFEGAAVYGLCGKNGSGKTMLMRVAAGLIRPTQGRVLINGSELGKGSDFPVSMGFLIENPSFLEQYSGFKNLELIAQLKNGIGEAEIKDALVRVGLNPEDGKKFKKYSLGMKQRLGIAAAIMERPQLIILDEPINALDDSGVAALAEIIRQEKERGALIILACHDSEFLSSVSDVILDVKCGRVRERE